MATSMTSTINRTSASAERYVPVAQVSFHTEDQLYQIRGIAKGYDAPYDPTDQLLSITTTKSLSSPAGMFTITLAGDGWFMQDGKTLLKPNDIAVIEMGYKAKHKSVTWVDGTTHTADNDLDTVMIGLIDTVTLNKNGGGSGLQPQVTTTIVGRDFGKILLKSTLKFYPELGWDSTSSTHFFLTETGWIQLFSAFMNSGSVTGSPAKILDVAMRFILKKLVDVQWKVYDENLLGGSSGVKTVGLANLLRYRFAETSFFIPFFMTAQQFEGPIWNLLDRVNIKPFTELFIDTRDRWEVTNTSGIPQLVNETCEEESNSDKGQLSDDQGKWAYPAVMFGQKDGSQAVLTYRNTPFTKDLWGKLRKHDFDDIDIISVQLSYSDNENYNVFWAGTTLTPFSALDLKRVSPPLINEDNVKRYGLNPLEVQIEGLQLLKEQESTQSVTLTSMAKSLNQTLKDWYEHNSEYVSGTIETRGKGSVKIGQRFGYTKSGIELYIEEVVQNFQVYGEWHSRVQVTRGYAY